MSRRTIRLLALAGVLALGAAACGNDDDDVVEDLIEDTTPAPDDDTDVDADDADDTDGPTLVVTPDSGLSDGDVVILEASGFTPGLTVGITQCADADDPSHGIETVGASECDLAGIQTLEIGEDGTGTAEYTVSGGPFGESQIVCDADHDCVLSVGELTADPDAERATVTIRFA